MGKHAWPLFEFSHNNNDDFTFHELQIFLSPNKMSPGSSKYVFFCYSVKNVPQVRKYSLWQSLMKQNVSVVITLDDAALMHGELGLMQFYEHSCFEIVLILFLCKISMRKSTINVSQCMRCYRRVLDCCNFHWWNHKKSSNSFQCC
jgi:hypothetical protein